MPRRLFPTPTSLTRPVRTALAAGAVVAVLAAAGCGEPSSPTPSASAAAGASGSAAAGSSPAPSGSAGASSPATPAPAPTGTLSEVTVTGDRNKLPTVTFTPPFAVADTVSKVLVPGNGPVVKKGQIVSVNYTGVNGRTGKAFDSSVDPQFKHVGKASFTLADGQLVPGFIKGLVGQKVGSRVLIAIPSQDGYGAQGSAQAGIQGTDTLVFVVDIEGVQTPLTKAEGTAVTPPATLPKVAVTNGIPTAIAKPAGPAPKADITQVLIKGTGKPIAKGDTVSLQAIGEVWASGKPVTDTWKNGGPNPVPVGTGQLIPAADKALLGLPIGSRVMVVATPPLGIRASGDVKATDSIVFVFDLLAAS